MQFHPVKISLVFLALASLGVLLRSPAKQEIKSLEVGEVVTRQPSSTPEVIKNDVYRLDRRIKAVLNGKEILTDIHYSGLLFIDWNVAKAGRKNGLFTFSLKDSITPAVFAEVELNDDYSLLQMKTSVPANEDEESAVLFLKDLISIYAFKTFEDTTGKYSCSLRVVSSGAKETVYAKRKTGYEEGLISGLAIEKSIHMIRIENDLIEASGVEETRLGKEISTSGIYQLKKLSPDEVIKYGMKKPQFNSRVLMNVASLKTDSNKVTAKNMNKFELEKKLAAVGMLRGKDRMKLFHELAKELKNNPDSLGAFMDWIKNELHDQQKVSMGIGILATVGSDKTQHELVQLFEQTKNSSPTTAHLILNSLASKEMKPTQEVIGMLNGVLDRRKENPELAENAAYALGAVGEVGKITELASNATSNSEKIIYIEALGNSGSNDALPFLLDGVKSSDPQVREKSVFALRFVNDERVKSVFEQSMNDVSMSVRYAVVRAVPFQANPHDYTALLKNCALQSTEAKLKTMCSATLAAF